MRISTPFIQTRSIDALNDQQYRLARTQNQLATGKRVLLPSDDPVATTETLTLRQAVATVEQHQANGKSAINRLGIEESVLENGMNVLQRVRELAIQGMNATQTNESRRAISAEVRQRLAEMLGIANSTDQNGEYLFSGSKVHTRPFAPDGAGGFTYAGDENQRFLQVSSERRIADSDPGSDVFQLIKNGNGTYATTQGAANTGSAIIESLGTSTPFAPSLANGYTITFTKLLPTDPITLTVTDTGGAVVSGPTPYVVDQAIDVGGALIAFSGTPANGDSFNVNSSQNQDVFQTLQNMIDALEGPVQTDNQRATFFNSMNRVLMDLDQGMEKINTVRATIGARLNAIDSQQQTNDDQILQSKKILSSIEDLDYAEAVTRLNLQLTGLQAAQQSYVKVQGLSLFNYIR